MNKIVLVKQRTQWKQWMAGIIATLSMVSGGTVYGWTTTNLSRLMAKDSPLFLTSDQGSWIVSLIGAGSIIGPFIGAPCADTFGRKKTLMLTSVLYAIGWLIDIFATTVEELYAARIILGAGIGLSYTTNPMYVSEIADVNIRGALGTLITVNVFTGTIIACSIGPFVAVKTLSIIMFIIPILFIFLFIWFPETPHFLATKKRYAEATESLIFFKGISNQQEAKEELEKLIVEIQQHGGEPSWGAKFRELFLPHNFKAMSFIVTLIITQLMSGNYTTMAYLEVLFRSASIGMNTNLATVLVLSMGMLSCALATVTIEKVGRRKLLMSSTLGTCITLLVLATYLLADENGIDVTSINWLPVIVIILFQLVYQLGIGAVPDALIGELFSTNVKSLGSAVVAVSDGVCAVFVAKFYQVIGDAAGQYVVYYVFAASSFCGFLFSMTFIPETMNKEISDIQKELGDTKIKKSLNETTNSTIINANC